MTDFNACRPPFFLALRGFRGFRISLKRRLDGGRGRPI